VINVTDKGIEISVFFSGKNYFHEDTIQLRVDSKSRCLMV